MSGELILGTSGFSYQHWRERFYPADVPQSRWLEFYAEQFSAVELNVTFYRLPTRETFAQWRERTPPGFRFIVKGSRVITHYRRLGDVDEALGALHDAAGELDEKLDCVLWQLPPTMRADVDRLASFCDRATRVFAPPVRHAFEFREHSWFTAAVYDVLRAHGCALVWADPGREGQSQADTADFAYLRFHHGPRETGAYEPAELVAPARRAADVLSSGRDAYALFNNDPGGWAIVNARQFADEVAGPLPAARSQRHSIAVE